MNLDTLFLSGGGVNCIAFLGVFKYLFDKGIVKHGFKDIKNIVCVSGSAFYVMPLLLGFSLDATLRICLEFDNEKLIDYDSFDLNNIFENFGLYDNDFFNHLCSVILERKGFSKEMTLKEMYDHTNVNWVLKTSNISKYSIEYINHISNPDLQIKDAIRMTTCVPLLFKPITYNNDLYVDGGLCGNFPIEYNRKLKSKDYLGIHIKVKDKVEKIEDILTFINRLQMVPTSPYDSVNKNKKRIIYIIVNELGTVFKKTNEENMNILFNGYSSTEKYFNSQ